MSCSPGTGRPPQRSAWGAPATAPRVKTFGNQLENHRPYLDDFPSYKLVYKPLLTK